MTQVHLAVGVGLIALNLAAGAWGGVAWLRRHPSVGFWYVLRAAQGAVAVQAFLGLGLLMAGREAGDDLHLLYGLLPLGVTVVAEAARAGVAANELGERDMAQLPRDQQRGVALAIVRRETGIMAVSALLIVFLALRAALTSSL